MEVSTHSTAPGETAPSVRAGFAMAFSQTYYRRVWREGCDVPAWIQNLGRRQVLSRCRRGPEWSRRKLVLWDLWGIPNLGSRQVWTRHPMGYCGDVLNIELYMTSIHICLEPRSRLMLHGKPCLHLHGPRVMFGPAAFTCGVRHIIN